MSKDNTLANQTLAELQKEEQDLQSRSTFVRFSVGFLLGAAVFSAVTSGRFFLSTGVALMGVALGVSHTRKLKAIQAEINRRNETAEAE